MQPGFPYCNVMALIKAHHRAGPESRSPSFLTSQPHSDHLLLPKQQLRSVTERHPAICDRRSNYAPTLAKMSRPSLSGRLSAKFTKILKSRPDTPHPSPPNPRSASDSASTTPEVTSQQPRTGIEGYQAACPWGGQKTCYGTS